MVQIWPTPRASAAMSEDLANVSKRLANGEPYLGKLEQAMAKYLEEKSQTGAAGNGGKLNPRWVEWLMGFPPGWTDLEDSETPSSPK